MNQSKAKITTRREDRRGCNRLLGPEGSRAARGGRAAIEWLSCAAGKDSGPRPLRFTSPLTSLPPCEPCLPLAASEKGPALNLLNQKSAFKRLPKDSRALLFREQQQSSPRPCISQALSPRCKSPPKITIFIFIRIGHSNHQKEPKVRTSFILAYILACSSGHTS